jgi:hypothetical protein
MNVTQAVSGSSGDGDANARLREREFLADLVDLHLHLADPLHLDVELFVDVFDVAVHFG